MSPTSKSRGLGQEKYLQKQAEVLSSDASLVEIDLVRSGRRVLALPAAEIPSQYEHENLVCVSPGWMRGRRELYPLPLRFPLPAIPIPLRKGEPRVNLDLQALVARTYETGRYEVTNYSVDPEPPLSPDDSAWAADLLRTAGRR